eukprot:8634200-Alexandrium_andersonii.AAC.1
MHEEQSTAARKGRLRMQRIAVSTSHQSPEAATMDWFTPLRPKQLRARSSNSQSLTRAPRHQISNSTKQH